MFGSQFYNQQTSWEEIKSVLEVMEAGRWTSVYTYDHFVPPWTRTAEVAESDLLPTLEGWSLLAGMAAVTTRLELGVLVSGNTYRNPALMAKMAATIDEISGGRCILGIGAGWKEDEYRAYNYPYPEPRRRVQQLEETLIILRKMWEEPGKLSYAGRHYQITDAWCEPKPQRPIPILVGGGGYTTMKHAAKYADIWNLPDAPLAPYQGRLAVLRRHLEAIDRDPASLRCSWFGRVAIGRSQAEAEARGRSRADKWTRERAFVGSPQQIAEQMQAFVDIGCDYFMVDIIGAPDPEPLALFTEEVMPALEGA